VALVSLVCGDESASSAVFKTLQFLFPDVKQGIDGCYSAACPLHDHDDHRVLVFTQDGWLAGCSGGGSCSRGNALSAAIMRRAGV
jgi:hypothetical protein